MSLLKNGSQEGAPLTLPNTTKKMGAQKETEHGHTCLENNHIHSKVKMIEYYLKDRMLLGNLYYY